MVKVSLGTKGIDFDWKEGGNPIKPPPKGLEPIGDSGWYHSPEVVDPRDCQFYPDSPWCGGNPIDPSLQVGVEINIDPCGFTITESGSALIKTPQFTQTYRAPGACRREYEKPPEAVPPPPAPKGYDKPPTTYVPSGFGPNEDICVAVTLHKYGYAQEWNVRFQEYRTSTYDYKTSASSFEYPSTYIFDGYQHLYQPPQAAVAKCIFNATYHDHQDATPNNPGYDYQSSTGDVIFAIDSRQEKDPKSFNPITYYDRQSAEHDPNFTLVELIAGKAKDVFLSSVNEPYYDLRQHKFTDATTGVEHINVYCDIIVYDYVYVARKPSDSKRRPPAPLLPDKDCCMVCCFSQTPQQKTDDSCCKEVLAVVKRIEKNLGVYPGKVTIFDTNESAKGAQSKVIEFSTVSQAFTRTIERVEKISKIIGIDDLPLTVPKSIVDPVDHSLIDLAIDFFTGDTEKINNLFEYHVWFLKQFSAVTGKFMIEIQVPDTDVLQEGNQGIDDDGNPKTPPKNKIVIPDMATALREIIMMQVALYKTLGLNLDTSLLTLSQSALCMKEIGRVGAEVDEIVDFLDYPSDDAVRDVPVFVTVPEKNLTAEEQNDLVRYLKTSQIKVKYQKWDGRESLRDLLTHFATRVGSRV